jgi:protein arginine N-methyltransferase 5
MAESAVLPIPPLSVGLWISGEQAQRISVDAAAHDTRSNRGDFVCMPLVKPVLPDGGDTSALAGQKLAQSAALSAETAVVSGNLPNINVVGVLSMWMELDSADKEERQWSEKAFGEQVAYAGHLGLPALIVPKTGFNAVNTWRHIHQVLLSVQALQVWVWVPLTDPTAASVEDGAAAAQDTWQWWDRLRTACEHNTHLGVLLELTAEVPDEQALVRWLGEPVRALSLSTDIFLTNKMGQPVLSRAHQRILKRFMPYRIQLVVHGDMPPAGSGDLNRHLRYLHHLWTTQEPPTQQDEWERPYLDYLQAPLQPLQDNLENATYQVFEKDPVKYVQYEEAVFQALRDRYMDKEQPCIMVVGAGRGPLVLASLRAAARLKKPVQMYAVEKNPNAVVYLNQLKLAQKWGDEVVIVSTDMRVWTAPRKADILVSELLGSFGDNELSPECLDGAQKFLAEDGLSIPCEYTSYLAPITSSKLHNEVKAYGDLAHLETPYVVKMHNVHQLAQSQPFFTFVHPNRDDPIDNRRYHHVTFQMQHNVTIHGLAGFFDAVLYKDVHISIDERNFSTGMFSWFPLFFPLRWPAAATPGDEVTVHMWRHVSSAKGRVW